MDKEEYFFIESMLDEKINWTFWLSKIAVVCGFAPLENIKTEALKKIKKVSEKISCKKQVLRICKNRYEKNCCTKVISYNKGS